jgi:hypothetical protein
MLRTARCLDSRLIYGGKADSLNHRQRSTSQKHYFLLLVLISPELFVFSVAVEKLKNENILDYNFARGSVWV